MQINRFFRGGEAFLNSCEKRRRWGNWGKKNTWDIRIAGKTRLGLGNACSVRKEEKSLQVVLKDWVYVERRKISNNSLSEKDTSQLPFHKINLKTREWTSSSSILSTAYMCRLLCPSKQSPKHNSFSPFLSNSSSVPSNIESHCTSAALPSSKRIKHFSLSTLLSCLWIAEIGRITWEMENVFGHASGRNNKVLGELQKWRPSCEWLEYHDKSSYVERMATIPQWLLNS